MTWVKAARGETTYLLFNLSTCTVFWARGRKVELVFKRENKERKRKISQKQPSGLLETTTACVERGGPRQSVQSHWVCVSASVSVSDRCCKQMIIIRYLLSCLQRQAWLLDAHWFESVRTASIFNKLVSWVAYSHFFWEVWIICVFPVSRCSHIC